MHFQLLDASMTVTVCFSLFTKLQHYASILYRLGLHVKKGWEKVFSINFSFIWCSLILVRSFARWNTGNTIAFFIKEEVIRYLYRTGVTAGARIEISYFLALKGKINYDETQMLLSEGKCGSPLVGPIESPSSPLFDWNIWFFNWKRSIPICLSNLMRKTFYF